MPDAPEPGFYAGAPDRTFSVGHSGEVWELAADTELGVLPVAELPAAVDPLEHELPSMHLRRALSQAVRGP